MVALIAEIVEGVGAKPLVAYDGPQALTLARAASPALVITDLLLPTMSGDTLVASLREELGTNLPVILMSALPEVETIVAGVAAVLAKPFRVLDLITVLGRFIGTGR